MALGQPAGHAVALLSLMVLGALLLSVAISDMRRRRISNKLCIAVALMALPYWLTTDPSILRFGIQIVCSAIVGMLLLIPFYYCLLGGGDVKLMAALALWFPPLILYQTIVLVSIGGGLLAVGVILFHRRRIARPTVPYGVAIAAAGLFQVLSRLNHLIG